MKQLFTSIFILITLTLTSCHLINVRPGNTKLFEAPPVIPADSPQGHPASTRFFPAGTYVTREEGYYNVSTDTIKLATATDTAFLFSIHRTITYQKLQAGYPSPPERLHFNWNGYYDEDAQTLYIVPIHSKILFQPDRCTLRFGEQLFEKIE